MTARGTLMNHCGATLVTKGDLEIIPAPPPTDTWYPVRHLDVLDSVEETLGNAGFEIQKYQLSISHGKQRFFGVLDIATPLAEGVSLSIGLRNSNDKSFRSAFASEIARSCATTWRSRPRSSSANDTPASAAIVSVRESRRQSANCKTIARSKLNGLSDCKRWNFPIRRPNHSCCERGSKDCSALACCVRSWMSGANRPTKTSRLARHGRCCPHSHTS